jgi:DNA gyrase inhibitor GyrI
MIATSEITLVDLPPLQVARFLFFGENPVTEGRAVLRAWAARYGLLDQPDRFPIFGTRTSQPIATDPQYGYAFMIALNSDQGADLGIDLLTLPEGRYAVTRCWEPEGGSQAVIDETWAALNEWLSHIAYVRDDRSALERHYLSEDTAASYPIDLYLPVVKLPTLNLAGETHSNGGGFY